MLSRHVTEERGQKRHDVGSKMLSSAAVSSSETSSCAVATFEIVTELFGSSSANEEERFDAGVAPGSSLDEDVSWI
jgi:hypothetical protein